MKKILVSVLSLFIAVGISDIAIAQTKKIKPQVKPQVKVEKVLTSEEKGQLFTQSYLDDLVDGETGYSYFCADADKSRFFSVRSYKILATRVRDKNTPKNLEYPELDKFGGSAKVRLDSSTKGGIQVTSTWTFYYSIGEMSGRTKRVVRNNIDAWGVCIDSIYEDNK